MMNDPVLHYNILHGYNVSLHRRILLIPHFPGVVRRYLYTYTKMANVKNIPVS